MVEGYSRHFILDRLEKFADLVKQAGSNLHQNIPNTVAIATFMYPPTVGLVCRQLPLTLQGICEPKGED